MDRMDVPAEYLSETLAALRSAVVGGGVALVTANGLDVRQGGFVGEGGERERGREGGREGEREREKTGYEPLHKAQTVVAGWGPHFLLCLGSTCVRFAMTLPSVILHAERQNQVNM